jgi:Na+/proline symporter
VKGGAALTPAAPRPAFAGFGAFFTLLTVVVSNYEMAATGKKVTSEHFNTAGRNVGAGLTAAVIVSQWTWAATLLQSSNVGWKYGVSGPFWYASGATIQILLFAMLAIQVKIRSPHMHTYLEVIKIRWGTISHIVFICFALACNVIVTSMLLLGGAATIEDLTGMDKEWSSFLIPLGVLIYTMMGGLRATFFASYIHTTVIFTVLIIFGFSVYASDTDSVGSAAKVYESLTAASLSFATGNYGGASRGPFPFAEGIIENAGLCYENADITTAMDAAKVATPTSPTELHLRTVAAAIASEVIKDHGHCSFEECDKGAKGLCPQNVHTAQDDKGKWWAADGCSATQICVPSYVTMTSGGGLAFGVINIVGNFGTVFVDQAYWQSAIAAEPKATVTGFLIGGMVWFAVPFFMATTFGLAGRALSMSPTAGGNCIISAGQAGQGLVPAKTIVETLGKGGAFALLMQLFMAVTSTGSAEVIAVSSVLTYDVYWTYLNPELKLKVQEGKVKWDKCLAAAGIADSPGEPVSVTQADALVKALFENGWAAPLAEGATPVSGTEILEGGDKLFQVKAYCVDHLSNSSAYEGKILVRMSRFFTCLFAGFMGFLAILLHTIGLGLGWVYQAMGNIIGSAVVPVAMAILVQRANGTVCTAAAIIGFLLAIMSWVWKTANDSPCEDECPMSADCTWMSGNQGGVNTPGAPWAVCDAITGDQLKDSTACMAISGCNYTITTTKGVGDLCYDMSTKAGQIAKLECGVTIDNMGALYPNLVGNIVAICTSGFIAVVGSLIMPDNDFQWEKLNEISVVDDVIPELKPDEQPEELQKDAKRANIQTIVLTLILVVFWPIPQHWSQGVFTETGFGWWIGCAFVWALLAAAVIIIMPPVEFIMKGKEAQATYTQKEPEPEPEALA